MLDDDRVISDDGDKCALFNSFFSSHSRINTPSTDDHLPNFTYATDHRIDLISTTPFDVFKILNGLNTSKASGPDGISNRVLRECALSLSDPLSRLFNLSFSLGVFPSSWKNANVIPIYKKEDRQSVKNYRPVSLLSNISKVMERIVHNALYSYCSKYKLLTEKNSGFKANDSTTNQLLFITNKIINALDDNKNACMVFLDITKAFDRVWHKGLLFKLKQFGVKGPFYQWCDSYLTNRSQRVVINGCESQLVNIDAGVPQGSILGPLFFPCVYQ